MRLSLDKDFNHVVKAAFSRKMKWALANIGSFGNWLQNQAICCVENETNHDKRHVNGPEGHQLNNPI
jgi:hypothetical protein